MKRAGSPRFDVDVDGPEGVSTPLIGCQKQEYCADPNACIHWALLQHEASYFRSL